MEEFMKKKIIILGALIVFLLLVGGGIVAYYFWYVPEKIRKEKLLNYEISKYIDNYYDLLKQRKFNEASVVLKNFRTFLKKSESRTSLHAFYYSYPMENALWYMQKDYEKMKANFPEMERYIKLLENKKYSSYELLFVKWFYIWDKYRYNYENKNYTKALELLNDFINRNGGEDDLKKKAVRILVTVYHYRGNSLLKLGQIVESEQSLQKALVFAESPDIKHEIYLKLAELELKYKDNIRKAYEYTLIANSILHSQRGYYFLALVHLKQNKINEAEKYYSLAAASKVYPIVDEKALTDLKQKLFKHQ